MRHFRRSQSDKKAVEWMERKKICTIHTHTHRHYLCRTTKRVPQYFLGVIFHRHSFSIHWMCFLSIWSRRSVFCLSFFFSVHSSDESNMPLSTDDWLKLIHCCISEEREQHTERGWLICILISNKFHFRLRLRSRHSIASAPIASTVRLMVLLLSVCGFFFRGSSLFKWWSDRCDVVVCESMNRRDVEQRQQQKKTLYYFTKWLLDHFIVNTRKKHVDILNGFRTTWHLVD